jgi:3-phenylpropionate/trans-cinnamate dioxygenase ferredoxin subunit
MSEWVEVCRVDEIERADVIRFDYAGRTFAVYRTEGDRYYATDGLCTHGKVHLAGGLVMDNIIECPKHNGRFDFSNGRAKGAPACIDLKTYLIRIEQGRIFILP